ncbi:hypothetical protein OPT61_g399 [Boeremia exigua]|uniref:Uncharacterized protein n=1 Tax=Boeremia exigua TaxID=749465 RepID=A0ACC2IUB4_9PLEO|nr:hypothetical protein OPT61_g399 [Boeremia exigua]
MAPGIDMSDKNAWDDSYLQESWNEAVAEYEVSALLPSRVSQAHCGCQKYHSIAKSGKRLEDVLTEKELKELREDHGDLIGEAAATPEAVAEADGKSDQMDTEDSMQETEDLGGADQAETQPQETTTSENPNQPQAANAGTTAPRDTIWDAMPQALLGTVQDENLKNIMMSWYYAGYYTGLHAGQQLPKNAPPKE